MNAEDISLYLKGNKIRYTYTYFYMDNLLRL